MRLINVFLFIFIFLNLITSAYSLQHAEVQYSMPIDYSLINETELRNEAETLFQKYLNTQNEKEKTILLNKLLSDYSILGELDRENPLYFARLGIIFDKLHKDRWAKSNFWRSSDITGEYPYAFYNFGNFYYDRSEFIKALKQYKKAYECGYNNDYDTLLKIGTIYEKFGDYMLAVTYLKQAQKVKPSEDLNLRIIKLEGLLRNNPLYDNSLKKRNK